MLGSRIRTRREALSCGMPRYKYLSNRAVRHVLAVSAGFLFLVILFTWPLVLDLAQHLRPHNDPRAFTWVMGWIATQIFEAPGAIFDGNILYPHGNTVAYSEPLLIPALLTFAPVYWISGNPILAYNVTLLLFMALSGCAAYWVALRLTGSRLGGWVAGVTFALSPFRTGYYNIIIMQVSFGIPLAFLAFARFLEWQRGRDLAWALFFVWCQAVSVWYFGIPLMLLLTVTTLGFALLRPGRWRWQTIGAALLGGFALALALLPVAWPYLETRWELGFQRTLADAARWPADLLSYADSGPEHRVYDLARSGRYPALFPGFTVIILAALALLWPRERDAPPEPQALRWTRRLVTAALVVTLVAVAGFLAAGGSGLRMELSGATLRMGDLDRAVVMLLFLSGAALALTGWSWVRSRRDRTLQPREWVMLLWALTLVFVLLTLGPVILLGGKEVGQGIYETVYAFFPALQAIRIPLRLGAIALFLLGLLAAFGLAWVERRLAGRQARYALAAVPLLLLAEYVSFPLQYDAIPWDAPPPVYRWLAQQPGDFAILEWPSGHEDIDANYLLWSLLHRKRLVHGISGFVPEFTQEIWAAVAALPDRDAMARLRSVYPLRFLIVHLRELRRENRDRWERWSEAPPAGFQAVDRFGTSLVFELESEPERQWRWRRTFSSDVAAARPRARLTVFAPREDPQIEPTVEVTFNGRPLDRLVLTPTPVTVEWRLPPPYPRADRNRLVLQQSYRLVRRPMDDSRYRIGRTGVLSPLDIFVSSASRDHGDEASIRINGVDVSPNRRGYNVAVVDPAAGSVSARAVFDTFIAETEGQRLAEFIRAVPPGWIVVAAIRDEGTAQLTQDAVEALWSLGGTIDPRGSSHTSYLLVGVKGAARATAIELAGHRRLAYVVGIDRRDRAMVVRDFRLE